MKSYEETTNSIFDKSEQIIEARRKHRKIITGISVSFCLCGLLLVSIGIWRGGQVINPVGTSDNTSLTSEENNTALYPNVKDNLDESKVESPDNQAANNKIVINTINGISAARSDIALMVDDFVEMSREEMIKYYGVDYIPDVPADIKPWEDERSGIYRRNGGTGEVYWDADILNYSNGDFTRSVHVEVNKGSYVLQDYLFFKGTEEKSIINNFEVLIGLSENGYYYSEFMYNGVGFCISANGVTEDEFVAIIASIIE